MNSQHVATNHGRSHRREVLVEPRWLEEHLDDRTLRVVEVDVSPVGYQEWHIDGAVLWNVYQDLKDSEYRPVGPVAIEQLLARSGILPDSTVVFYGYAPAMGFWLMKLYGHPNVRILDCSRQTWRAEGRPWTSAVPTQASTRYPLPPQDGPLRADQWKVESLIRDPAFTLIDVRTDAEYRGERFWPSGGLEPGGRAGHVPSARHLPIDNVYDERGAFRSVADLQNIFSSVDLNGDGEIVSYCTIGGRASTAWFVLTYLLGRERVSVYDGSWAEWGRTLTAPVEIKQTQHSPTRKVGAVMPGLLRKSLDSPEETRKFQGETGQLQVVNTEEGAVGRATFLPGWKWSEHVKPIAQTDSCQAAHTCYFVSGRMTVVMDDGEEMEYGPGDFAVMAPGHDAWIVGDEPCVVIDWQGFADYAKPR
jgi:thiosulfate/3-mercaptopyruvate sulfurtransferase